MATAKYNVYAGVVEQVAIQGVSVRERDPVPGTQLAKPYSSTNGSGKKHEGCRGLLVAGAACPCCRCCQAISGLPAHRVLDSVRCG